MKIDIVPVFGDIKKEQLEDTMVIVFDVLRATSTIVTAIKNDDHSIF